MKSRPTEVGTGVAGAAAALIAYFAGVDEPAITAMFVVLIAALPSGITWFVELLRRKEREERKDELGHV